VTYEIIEDYNRQNTRYLELRSTPKELKGKSKSQYLEAIFEVMEAAKTDFPRMKVRYILSVNRQAGVDAAKEAIELAIAHRGEFLVGIELSGDPRCGDFSEFE
jgi:adenosine deaminase